MALCWDTLPQVRRNRDTLPRSPADDRPWFITLCGCSNKLSGSLEINGKSFTPTACENLVRIGQRGVELRGESSRKVRLIERPDGGADVYWVPRGSGRARSTRTAPRSRSRPRVARSTT